MTTDIGFLFSVVAVNMSLSSLAGLVIAFRRTGVWAAYDLFRLRQIVEWGFADVLLALLAFPLVWVLGSEAAVLRALSTLAGVYIVVNLLVLKRRVDSMHHPGPITYAPMVIVLDLALLALVVATSIQGTMVTWQLLLLLLTARPMLAFLLVLATLGRDAADA